MKFGSAGMDASNKIIRGQSTPQDLFVCVLTFSTCVTGVGRIQGRHKDISFQSFTMTSVVKWTTSTWVELTSRWFGPSRFSRDFSNSLIHFQCKNFHMNKLHKFFTTSMLIQTITVKFVKRTIH